MMDLDAARSGKTHRDENFPVAGLIAPRHRAIVLAFYDFVRTGDDIADHTEIAPAEKIAMLDRMEAELTGNAPASEVSTRLRQALDARSLSPRHALDLLRAFRLDATKTRYRDFDDLIDYCRLSAMPVGRFVLDVHGESERLWPANDALCAALQIINHMQDCAKDFRALDRVYIPQDILAAHGADVAMLDAERAPPPLRAAITDVATRTRGLLATSAAFSGGIRDLRLACEVAAIQRLAERLNDGLLVRDPLLQNVHHSKVSFAAIAAAAAALRLLRHPFLRAASL
jgi:squalene synthase HpnC